MKKESVLLFGIMCVKSDRYFITVSKSTVAAQNYRGNYG